MHKENTGDNYIFLAAKRVVEKRFPLLAIPPMHHWTFGRECGIKEGDTAWVTFFPDKYCLILVAPFCVGGPPVGKEKADAICETPFEFSVPAECLTDAYRECLDKGLPGGLAHSDLAANSTGGMRLKMSYEPFELRHHIFADRDRQDLEFPKFLDISDSTAGLRFDSPTDRLKILPDGAFIPRQLSSPRRLTPDSAARLREIWQSAKSGFQHIPEGISLSEVTVEPAFTIV